MSIILIHLKNPSWSWLSLTIDLLLFESQHKCSKTGENATLYSFAMFLHLFHNSSFPPIFQCTGKLFGNHRGKIIFAEIFILNQSTSAWGILWIKHRRRKGLTTCICTFISRWNLLSLKKLTRLSNQWIYKNHAFKWNLLLNIYVLCK